MKKDRNSFFSQYGYSAMNTNMFPNNQNMNMNPMPMMDNTSELDSRISKLEREIQRLDYRLSKLEGISTVPSTNISNTDYNFANSMYMV